MRNWACGIRGLIIVTWFGVSLGHTFPSGICYLVIAPVVARSCWLIHTCFSAVLFVGCLEVVSGLFVEVCGRLLFSLGTTRTIRQDCRIYSCSRNVSCPCGVLYIISILLALLFSCTYAGIVPEDVAIHAHNSLGLVDVYID